MTAETAPQGFLSLADITGYTAYLAGSELDHAQSVLAELLELLVAEMTPTMTLCEVEGDAIYTYAWDDRFTRGEALLELIESTYVRFRDRVDGIRRTTTCQCNACVLIPNLDLKFIIHHGAFVLQRVAGTEKPVGSAVNLLHRLAKNHVTQETGWRGYGLFSQPAIQRIGLNTDGMRRLEEEYESLGAIETFTVNLSDRYKELKEVRRIFVSADESDFNLGYEFEAPPAVVWDWLNDPLKRSMWEEITVESDGRPGERVGVGTTNHCRHGDKAVSIQTILDWRPLTYSTVEVTDPRFGLLGITTVELTPDGDRTRLEQRFKFQRSPRWLMILASKLMFEPGAMKAFDRLHRMLKQGSQPESSAAP
ncbi:MAG TPA: DUF2652 domain-containing protein [Anaerolineales bacterium]|nr:DUF2652 domain-containing protein [Anaerolineales bacterium]